VWRHTWRKNEVNCAVLTGNSVGLRTVISSRLSHTQNCAVHLRNPTVSSLYLPKPRRHHAKALNSISRWASHNIFLFKHHFLLHVLRFLFLFSDNIMPDVASKQQTKALFLSITDTLTRRHHKPDGKPVLYKRTFSSVFHAVFWELNCTVYLRVYGALYKGCS
jgi:hypothetical protein